MKFNFDICVTAVLKHEGGYVNHPKDPGGETNRGITKAEYDSYCDRHKLPRASVHDITEYEAECVYRDDYWNKVNADNLPSGLDYAVFDFAVNSGCSRAARTLQEICGTTTDGSIGPASIAAVNARPINERINDYCDAHEAFLKQCRNFDVFGEGWLNRAKEVRSMALHLWQGSGGY